MILVVVQNPGKPHAAVRSAMSKPEMLEILLDACASD
jgi:hypothetical protein